MKKRDQKAIVKTIRTTLKKYAAERQDAWSAFCESMGTRCTQIVNGVRCDNGVVGATERCAEHQRKEKS